MGRKLSGWRKIPGYPGYEIFEDGTILSSKKKNPRFIRARKSHWGYEVVSLRKGVNDGRLKFVHYFVMLAFVGPRGPDQEINHKDGDKENNHISNLEYVTKSQNIKHAYDNGLMFAPRGADSRFAKLTPDQVLEIIKDTRFHKEIARDYGVSTSAISFIKSGRNWRHLTEGKEIVKRPENPGAKLKIEQVYEIQKARGKQKDIAKKYGVSQPTVSGIKSGKLWSWLKEPVEAIR